MNFPKLNAYIMQILLSDDKLRKLMKEFEKELETNEFLLEGRRILTNSVELLELDVNLLYQIFEKRRSQLQTAQGELKAANECYKSGCEFLFLISNLELEKIIRFDSLLVERATENEIRHKQEYFTKTLKIHEAMENRNIVQSLRQAEATVKSANNKVEESCAQHQKLENILLAKMTQATEERNRLIISIIQLNSDINNAKARRIAMKNSNATEMTQSAEVPKQTMLININNLPTLNDFFASYKTNEEKNKDLNVPVQPRSILSAPKSSNEGTTSSIKKSVHFACDEQRVNDAENIFDCLLDTVGAFDFNINKMSNLHNITEETQKEHIDDHNENSFISMEIEQQKIAEPREKVHIIEHIIIDKSSDGVEIETVPAGTSSPNMPKADAADDTFKKPETQSKSDNLNLTLTNLSDSDMNSETDDMKYFQNMFDATIKINAEQSPDEASETENSPSKLTFTNQNDFFLNFNTDSKPKRKTSYEL